jgi:hypothetical protein
MAGADDVVAMGVHEFPEEVMVEITRRDEEGFLVVRSFQFDYGEDDELLPVQPVPDPFRETVDVALTDAGYVFGD